MKKLIGILVVASVAALAIYYISTNLEKFAAVLELSPLSIGIILTTSLVYALAQGFLYNSVLHFFSVRLTHTESFGALMLTLFGNYFFPFAGFGARGVYLQRAHGLRARDYTLSVVAIVIVELTVYAGLGATALLILFPIVEDQIVMLLLFFLCAFTGGVFLIYLQLPFAKFLPNKLSAILDDWYATRSKAGIRSRLIALTLLQYALYTGLFAVAFLSLNLNITAAEVMLHSALSDFGFIFKVAPAGVGTYEALVIFSTSLVGKQAADAVMVLLIVRFAMLFWPLILTPFFMPMFLRQTGTNSFSELVKSE